MVLPVRVWLPPLLSCLRRLRLTEGVIVRYKDDEEQQTGREGRGEAEAMRLVDVIEPPNQPPSLDAAELGTDIDHVEGGLWGAIGKANEHATQRRAPKAAPQCHGEALQR